MLDHMDKSIMGKCSIGPFQAPNRDGRPDQFQLAGALRKKGGQQFVSRDTRELFEPNLLDCLVNFLNGTFKNIEAGINKVSGDDQWRCDAEGRMARCNNCQPSPE